MLQLVLESAGADWNWNGTNVLVSLETGIEITLHTDRRYGGGSYGEVFHATYGVSGVPVVVKLFEREEGKRSFERESEIYNKLRRRGVSSHAVVTLIDTFAFAPMKLYGMIIERMDGTLTSLCRGIGSTEDKATCERLLAFINLYLAYDLDNLHRAGIYHCDVKPQNVLYKYLPEHRSYLIKLADFGLSCTADGDVPCRALGTPTFMSPELQQLQRTLGWNQLIPTDRVAAVMQENDAYAAKMTVNVLSNVMQVGAPPSADSGYAAKMKAYARVHGALPPPPAYDPDFVPVENEHTEAQSFAP